MESVIEDDELIKNKANPFNDVSNSLTTKSLRNEEVSDILLQVFEELTLKINSFAS